MSDRKYSTEFSLPSSDPKYVTAGQGCVIMLIMMLVIFTASRLQYATDKHLKTLEKRIDALEQRLKGFE